MSRFWNAGVLIALPAILAAAIGCPIAFALQSQTAGPPRFDAASLKLAADQDVLETRPKRSIGRFRWNTTLLYMLSYSYQMEWWRISETPGLGNVYSLDATTPPNTTQDQVRLMLQNLLIERFHLQVHRATREISEGYTLTVSQGGPKLVQAQPAEPADSGVFNDGYVGAPVPTADTILLRGHNASTLQLVECLQRLIGTSVLDRTNLPGRYDFELSCTRDGPQISPDLLASCVKRAGLVMGKYKGPAEFLVIDHLGKLVEN